MTNENRTGLRMLFVLAAALLQAIGCAPATLANGVTPTSIAVDDTDVYFTNFSRPQPTVVKVPTRGGTPTTLWSDPREVPAVASVTLHDNFVYWIAPGRGSFSGVWRVSKTGGTASQVFSAELSSIEPQGLVANDESQPVHAYFGQQDPNSQLYDIQFQTVQGVSQPSVSRMLPPTPPSGVLSYYPNTLAVDANNVYFLSDSFNSDLFSVPRAGGSPVWLNEGRDVGMDESVLATDGASLYFNYANNISKMPVGGGAIVAIVPAGGTLTGLVARGGALYWACSSCGSISRYVLATSTLTVLVSGEGAISSLAVAAPFLYWGTPTALRTSIL